MTSAEIRTRVLQALSSVAPEADAASLRSNVSLRDQLDIDSMDFLNFVIALHKDLKVNIAEADYPKLLTLDGCVAYLTAAVEKQRSKVSD
jgi:acyl carrier protein